MSGSALDKGVSAIRTLEALGYTYAGGLQWHSPLNRELETTPPDPGPGFGEGATRANHLAWCKRRALEYCDAGDLTNAMASMLSDLDKHPKTAGHMAAGLMFQLSMAGRLSEQTEMNRFILGFR